MKRRYILLLSALVLFTGAVIMTGCLSQVKPQTPKYKVTLNSGKHGSVTVKPSLPADGMVEAHMRLSFTAQPDEGYEVDTWTGANRNYPDNTTATLNVITDTTVSVTFKRIGYSSEKQKYKVTLIQPEHGTVTVKPALSEDGMIPQHTRLTFTVTPEPGWKVNKWTGAGIWQNKIGYDVENNEVHLSVTEDVTVSVTMIEEGKADASLLIIDSTGRLTGVTDKYRLKGSLALPNTVTAIGSEALTQCTGLTSVIIPDSVTSIGYKAFYECTGLTGVTIGNNVTEIDGGAFFGCHNLISITVPDSVTEIGGGAFYDCKSLTSVTIGKGVTKIASSAFDGCNKIKTLNINCKTVPYLGMTSLKELTLGDNVNEIGERAFANGTDLTNITIPGSVTKIGNEAFQGCTGLTDVIIPDSVVEIGKSAFKDCSNIISLAIGKGLTSIYLGDYHDESPFDGCNKIEKLNINSKTVPRLNIKSLKVATLGEQVTEISYGAFSYCKSLTTITISHNVTKIGERAFENCTHLTNVTIPNNVTKIGSEAFKSCIGLTSVTIGKGVTKIGSEAFKDCTHLTSLTIPDSVTEIGREAFRGCTGLTDVIIPDSVTEIGKSAFKDCSNIISLTIGKGLTTIHLGDTDYLGDNQKTPFNGCNQIEKLDINCSITPRLDITSLKEIIIGDNVTTISDNAFSGCTGLTTLTIPDNVTKIGERAFNNCSGLITITIGKGLEHYYYSSFDGCNNVKTLNINCRDAVDFGFSQTLTELNLGDNVTRIRGYAFSECSHLTNITIPESVAFIGVHAFDKCSNLTTAIFKSKASWKLEYEYNGDHINIQEELENPSTAAQYLKYQYTHFSWTKN